MTTYAELTTQIQDWAETSESVFVAEIPVFIANAELRIYRSVDLHTTIFGDSTVVLTQGQRNVTIPTDVIVIKNVSLLVGTTSNQILQKDRTFIRDYSPDHSVEGTPKYYAWSTDTAISVAPSPDATSAAGTMTVDYTKRPTGLSGSQTTTWLSLNAPDVLFYACQLEAVIFLQKEQDTIASYKAGYEQALKGLLMEENARNRIDEYRNGEIRIPM